MVERPQRRQLPFSLYVTGAFVLTAAMTALIIASVLVLAWHVNRNRIFTDNDIYLALLAAGLIAVGLSLVLGVFFAKGIVGPVRRISKTASSIESGDLSARTDLHGEDELSQLGERFDEMAESIERDRDLERQLIADVAHELRTPLMAIQATVEAMQDGVLPADEQRLETLSAETRRLGRLVEALLHLNRLENGTLVPNMVPMNLTELVDGLAMTHQALIEASELTLRTELEEDVRIIGDRDLVYQAIANLLSNAVRYTLEGGSITLTLHRENGYAVVAITDTGIGISESDLKMVFSRFWRADGARDRSSGGLGIGLAIVKEVIDQHRGRISVDSKLGEGSTFTMYIPLADEDMSNAGMSGKIGTRRAAKAAKREQGKQRKEQRRGLGEKERQPVSLFGIRVPLSTKKDDDTKSDS